MKSFRTQSGPFAERPYYKVEEIEQICTDELQNVGLFPLEPSPVRIERFIEKRFGVHPRYDELPEGILGFTKFGLNGVEEIVVSRLLAEEQTKTAERRINTTLAHETGHGLLHGHLFALTPQSTPLFEEDVDLQQCRILCRNEAVQGDRIGKGSRYDGRWWEFQANQAMGSLLLPVSLVEKCLDTILVVRGTLGMPILEPERREDAIRLLAEAFDVNPIVARLRLQELYPEGRHSQLTL